MPSLALMHISDLHVGDDPANSSFSALPGISLGNAHDFLLAKGLSLAADDAAALACPSDADPLHVIASGDLTANGGEKQFLVAHTLLRSLWREQREPEAPLVGLGIDDSIHSTGPEPRFAAVPGNHDQWRGASYLKAIGYTAALKPAHFRATPWCRLWIQGDLALEVWGLDSNAGLSPTKGSWSQKGEFDLSKKGEFEQFRQQIQASVKSPPAKHVVRALMFHHTLSELEPTSLDRVLKAAEDFPLAALLTGHVHNFLNQSWDTRPLKTRKVLELRCASTLQGPENRQKPAPGFLVHKVFLDNAGLPRWHAWRFFWDTATKQFALFQPDLTTPFANFQTP